MQCGTLKVPLDYQKPEGRTIDVAVSRLPSKNPEKRRGILLTNPCGPSPGLGYLAFLVTVKMPQAVLDSYDLIGLDARGMGRSTPVKRDLTEEQQIFGNIPPYGRNAGDVAKRAELSQQIAEQCYDAYHLVDQLMSQPLQVILAGRIGYTGSYESGMQLWKLAPNPVDLMVIENAGHYEMYDVLEYVDAAVDRLVDFDSDYL
jgi:pimeloyl-ACP methyl ester carboxylesterase